MSAQNQSNVIQGANGPALDANGQPVTAASKAPSTPPAPLDTPPAPAAGAAGTPPAGGHPAPGTPPAGDPPKAPEPRELGDDDEPKPGEKITLSADAFKARLQRATRSQMRAEFGTDDPKVLKEKLSKLETLEREDADRKKAQMTEIDRLKAERDEAQGRALAAEQRSQATAEEHAYQQATQELKSVANEYIKPKYWKVASGELAEHLASTYDEAALEAMPEDQREKVVRDWFTKYVAENPELAKGEAPKTEQKTEGGDKKGETKTAPITTNKAPNTRTPPVLTTGQFAGKTLAPGHPNSMTAAEVSQWKRDNPRMAW